MEGWTWGLWQLLYLGRAFGIRLSVNRGSQDHVGIGSWQHQRQRIDAGLVFQGEYVNTESIVLDTDLASGEVQTLVRFPM